MTRRRSRDDRGVALLFSIGVLLILLGQIVTVETLASHRLRERRQDTRATLVAAAHLDAAETITQTHAMLGRGPFAEDADPGVWHSTASDERVWTNDAPLGGGWRHYEAACDFEVHASCWRAAVSARDVRTFSGGVTPRFTREVRFQAVQGCDWQQINDAAIPQTGSTAGEEAQQWRTLNRSCRTSMQSRRTFASAHTTGYAMFVTEAAQLLQCTSGDVAIVDVCQQVALADQTDTEPQSTLADDEASAEDAVPPADDVNLDEDVSAGTDDSDTAPSGVAFTTEFYVSSSTALERLYLRSGTSGCRTNEVLVRGLDGKPGVDQWFTNPFTDPDPDSDTTLRNMRCHGDDPYALAVDEDSVPAHPVGAIQRSRAGALSQPDAGLLSAEEREAGSFDDLWQVFCDARGYERVVCVEDVVGENVQTNSSFVVCDDEQSVRPDEDIGRAHLLDEDVGRALMCEDDLTLHIGRGCAVVVDTERGDAAVVASYHGNVQVVVPASCDAASLRGVALLAPHGEVTFSVPRGEQVEAPTTCDTSGSLVDGCLLLSGAVAARSLPKIVVVDGFNSDESADETANWSLLIDWPWDDDQPIQPAWWPSFARGRWAVLS